MLVVNQPINVQYKKDTELTNRTIIPTHVPHNNIKALDVTDLSNEEMDSLTQMIQEFSEYQKQARKSIVNFETWLEITNQQAPPIKWRTFKIDNLSVQ